MSQVYVGEAEGQTAAAPITPGEALTTIGAIKHESGASWATISAAYQTVIAWLAAFLVFQGGRLIGLQ
jgi:hypothetical protein